MKNREENKIFSYVGIIVVFFVMLILIILMLKASNFDSTGKDAVPGESIAINEEEKLPDIYDENMPVTNFSSSLDVITLRHEFIDNYIILTTNKNKDKIGLSKIYNRKGKFLNKIENIITSYTIKNELVNGFYPNMKDNIYYYRLDDNVVNIKGVNLENINNALYEEKVSEV